MIVGVKQKLTTFIRYRTDKINLFRFILLSTVNMWRLVLFSVFIVNVLGENIRIVELDEGPVSGEKYWNGNFYEFYGVPYATAPTGRDKFKVSVLYLLNLTLIYMCCAPQFMVII